MRTGLLEASSQQILNEDLSLARGIARPLRDEVNKELYLLAPKAPEMFPSWESRRLRTPAPYGLRQMNPSVTRFGERILCLMRCTDYIIDDRGPRQMDGREGSRNLLLELDPSDLSDLLRCEVTLPKRIIEEAFSGIRVDFEDARIFEYRSELWATATMCFKNHEGWPEQWLARIDGDTLTDTRRLKSPHGIRRPEKNWIPFVDAAGRILFVYLCDPVTVLDSESKVVIERYPRIDATRFRGSSQGIVFDGGLLALVHTPTMHYGWPKNYHRFVWFTPEFELAKLTDAFKFLPYFSEDYLNGYQYGMGLCWHPDQRRLLLSYSIGDGAAFIAALDASEVAAKLRSV